MILTSSWGFKCRGEYDCHVGRFAKRRRAECQRRKDAMSQRASTGDSRCAGLSPVALQDRVPPNRNVVTDRLWPIRDADERLISTQAVKRNVAKRPFADINV